MSFEDLMKLKEKLGSKIYNETIFSGSTSRPTVKKTTKPNFKRENKNRPREEGVKRPVAFLGKIKTKKSAIDNERRDPRFDPNIGEFDSAQFAKNFEFVKDIRDKELIELQNNLKSTKDPKEQKKIKYLIQRMNNQKIEKDKQKIREQVLAEEQVEIKKAKLDYKKPYYITERKDLLFKSISWTFLFQLFSFDLLYIGERKARELVKQYEQLKDTGKLDKHLEKRRKKVASRDRKKLNFDT